MLLAQVKCYFKWLMISSLIPKEGLLWVVFIFKIALTNYVSFKKGLKIKSMPQTRPSYVYLIFSYVQKNNVLTLLFVLLSIPS